MRHRQAAARAGRRQHARRRDAEVYRNLWEHIGKKMPKKGRGKAGEGSIPLEPADRAADRARSALRPLRRRRSSCGSEAGIDVPPVFIVVCNNTSTSKLVYEWISGFERESDDGEHRFENGRLELFRNYDEYGNRLRAPEHAADRQRAARIRRSARHGLPRRWRPTRSSGSGASIVAAHRRRARRREASPTRICCAR